MLKKTQNNQAIAPHIPLSKNLTHTLLQRSFSEDLNPTLFPSREETIAQNPQVISLCSQIKDYLTQDCGFCIIKLDADLTPNSGSISYLQKDFLSHSPFPIPHSQKALNSWLSSKLGCSPNNSLILSGFWNLFTSLAKPLPQYNTGELSFKVYNAGKAPTKNHYSNTNRGGGFHTDGTFLPITPFYVGLVCIRQAKLGGESILIDGRKLYHELSLKYPQTLTWLEKEYQFDCCGQIPGRETRAKAIFNPQTNSPFIQYLRGYIINGHQKSGIPLEAEALKSLDILDELASQEKFQYIFKLNPGEMLIFNNHIMLHGRKTFVDGEADGEKRLMFRLYGGDYQ